MIQEGNMGEWKTVFEDEVEGRLVAVKVYHTDQAADEDGDEGPAVRVTTTSVDEYPAAVEEDGDTLLLEREDISRLITLEPDGLEDLEGELMEVGFSPEAATIIAGKVPA
jgi:hypothetical protein